MTIIQNKRGLLNNTWTFTRWQIRQIIHSFSERNRSNPNCRGWFLLYIPFLGWNFRKCWSLCWPTDDALEEANSSREWGLRGKSCSGPPFLDLGSVKTSLEESFDTEWWMFSKTHKTQDGSFFFLAKYPGREYQRFLMWAGNKPLRLAPAHLLGDSGIPHTSKQDSTGQIVPKYRPNMVHRRLLW